MQSIFNSSFIFIAGYSSSLANDSKSNLEIHEKDNNNSLHTCPLPSDLDEKCIKELVQFHLFFTLVIQLLNTFSLSS